MIPPSPSLAVLCSPSSGHSFSCAPTFHWQSSRLGPASPGQLRLPSKGPRWLQSLSLQVNNLESREQLWTAWLQSSDWGSHTRSSFLAELAGSQDGCHSKGCLEPPCRLRAWEHTGLSTNTSSELASRLFTEAGKASPSSTPLLGVYCPVGWALFPWRQSGSSSSCRDYQEDECEEGAEERPWALPCLDWGEGTTRTREQ